MTQGSQYTDEQRGQAVIAYSVTGSVKASAQQVGIPSGTMQGWKSSDWFNEQLEEIRAENADRFVSKAQDIIDASMDNTLAKLSEDDVSARDSAIIGGVYYDKLRLALNQPSSIRADSGGVQALAKQFADLSAQWREKNARVIAVQEQDTESKSE